VLNKTYNPNGTSKSLQNNAEKAAGVLDTFAYDADGDVVSSNDCFDYTSSAFGLGKYGGRLANKIQGLNLRTPAGRAGGSRTCAFREDWISGYHFGANLSRYPKQCLTRR